MKDFQMGWSHALDYIPFDQPCTIATPRRVPVSARDRVRHQVLDLDPYIMNLYVPPPKPSMHKKAIPKRHSLTLENIRSLAVKAAKVDKQRVISVICRFSHVGRLTEILEDDYPTVARSFRYIINEDQ